MAWSSKRHAREGKRMNTSKYTLSLILPFASLFFAPRLHADVSSDDVIMRAMVDELDRSMSLTFGDLPKPYFLHLHAQDRKSHTMSAEYGALTGSDETHNRLINIRTRVGSYELDNTNFRRQFGQFGLLPLEDDYDALRWAIWLLVDRDYKQAVENLTHKHAYLKDKQAEDRPPDYSAAPKVIESRPKKSLAFDPATWERNIERLSVRFHAFPKIQDGGVTLFAGTADEWIVNSEGTRLRVSDTGVQIEVHAELQAPDGMPISDSVTFLAETIEQLPPLDKMISDVDTMCKKLIALSEAPVLEQYSGPVLFDATASGRVFETLLGDGICARPQPVGASEDPGSLEKKLGLRILPRTFNIVDDPQPRMFKDKLIAGYYEFDDEAVPPQKVAVVEKGILKTMLSSRAPTRKISQTNGHGRSGGMGDARAEVGCLYISDETGVSADELKKELVQAAQEEGLPFALRVEMVEPGEESIGDPIYAYRVWCEDGREEMVRGMQFRPVQTRSLKRLLAAGNEPKLYNSMSRVSSSYVAPAVVFEELDLAKIEREFNKLPILPAPAAREK
jgi:TldD protein